MKIIWYFIFFTHQVCNIYGSENNSFLSKFKTASSRARYALINYNFTTHFEDKNFTEYCTETTKVDNQELQERILRAIEGKNTTTVNQDINTDNQGSSLKIDKDYVLSYEFIDKTNIIWNEKYEDRDSFLLWAAKKGYIGILRSVFNYWNDRVSNIDFGNDENSKSIEEQIQSEILRRKIPIDWPNKDGQTLLMLAACHKRLDIINTLLENGADPNIADKNNLTALDYALIYSCNYDVSVYLDIFNKLRKDNVFCTPLQMKKFKLLCGKYSMPEDDSSHQKLKKFFEDTKSFFTEQQYAEINAILK